MPKFQPYSDAVIRNLVLSIINKVIESVGPKGKTSVKNLTDRITKDYENGGIFTKEKIKTSGISDIDLIVLMVVPTVIHTLKNLIEEGFKLESWRRFDKNDKKTVATLVDTVVDEKFQEVTIKIKSQKASSKNKSVKQATKLFTKQVLGIVETEGLSKKGRSVNYRLAGDSTIDAPPPEVKKKKRKSK